MADEENLCTASSSGEDSNLYDATHDKADSSSETECVANDESIEVEAIEFNEPKQMINEGVFSNCPRRLLLLILAFLVIMITSAIAGFVVLGGKDTSSLLSTISSGGVPNDLEIELDEDDSNNEFSEPVDDLSDSEDRIDISTNTTDTVPTPSSAPLIAGSPAPSARATQEGTSELSTGLSEVLSEGLSDQVSSEESQIRTDPRCPEHDLVVSSSCLEGQASALSVASFCFASKRDGDWYWIRNSNGYDVWDYTDETEGDVTLMNLSTGNYIISLVRDSMQPYDEIISHEFTVPECA